MLLLLSAPTPVPAGFSGGANVLRYCTFAAKSTWANIRTISATILDSFGPSDCFAWTRSNCCTGNRNNLIFNSSSYT